MADNGWCHQVGVSLYEMYMNVYGMVKTIKFVKVSILQSVSICVLLFFC